METGRLAFTAVYLKSNSGYIGFIEELPGVNSHGRTIDEARDTLQKLAAVVFDEERRGAEELIEGKDVVRESFFIPIPRAARPAHPKAGTDHVSGPSFFISAAAYAYDPSRLDLPFRKRRKIAAQGGTTWLPKAGVPKTG
jgi:predicted RNase H-like HicB family nuclease